MNLSQLPKTVQRSKKRLGRGTSSGKGKTSARGQKGQKARGKVPMGFIGGTLPLYKKLPYNRGHKKGGYRRSYRIPAKSLTINVSNLQNFAPKSEINLQALIEQKLVSARDAKKRGVKLVGQFKLLGAYTVNLPASKSAAESIQKAGGQVVNG